MTLVRETFVRDPLTVTIPNDGVAKVTTPTNPEEWEVLKYELEHFVCEGEYERGLQRVLSSFSANLGRSTQPAVWVSGFFGCGKSHFVRVLEYLWRDVTMPDGASTRSLVTLTPDIDELLRELTTAGKREGGLWSAAGTLSSGAAGFVRASVLGVIFKSAGLPVRIPQAKLVLYLQAEGVYDAVEAALTGAGRDLAREMRNMYVSSPLAEAILQAKPDFAADANEVKQQLREQFPNRDDVNEEDMVDLIDQVLRLQSSEPEKLPCALIVLDEVQQYVGDDPERCLHLQEVVEACSSRFGSNVLFVGTGQSSLIAAPQLSKLRDRFTVAVELSDTDVEKVIRKVVLQKQPNRVPELKDMLGKCSGEIDRHLRDTQIAPRREDQAVLHTDYPLLPVRRRFWERVLRAVDPGGFGGQLRTQLRITHEAARATGDLPVGTVIGGDFIFDQQESSMLQSGMLLPEVDANIRELRDGTEEGELRARLCALIFLVDKLPSDLRIKPTVETLADLLVTDLPAGSAALRQQMPALLEELVEQGKVMRVDQEYRLQTREGAEWEQAYRTTAARLRNDDAAIAAARTSKLKDAVADALREVRPVHGQSKTPRQVEIHYAEDAPDADLNAITVWVRDDWSATDKAVRTDAREAGIESPTLFVHLPRVNTDALREQLAGLDAANEVLETKGMPSSPEGRVARSSIETRRDTHARRVDALIREVLAEATVYQGGGNVVSAVDLAAAITQGAEFSMDRLYPQFQMADHSGWGKVMTRAREGNADALQNVGYSGDAVAQPVCRELLQYIGTAGKKGAEIRGHFGDVGYGWPRDAIDGALCVLTANGALRATRNGAPVPVGDLDHTRISQTDFKAESVTLSTTDRLAIRKLLQDAGHPAQPGEEAVEVPRMLDSLVELAESAGGPAPLPVKPNANHLADLRAKKGNELLAAVLEARDRLQADREAWAALAQKSRQRMPEWSDLQRLLKHVEPLPVHEQVAPQAQAVLEQRSLLDDPDPVAPLLADLEQALRQAVTEAREAHLSAGTAKLGELTESESWKQLTEEQQEDIKAKCNLQPMPELTIGSRSELLSSLDAMPLSQWEDATAALAERVAQALTMAAKLLEPKAERVVPPHAQLATEAEVDEYLSGLRERIMEHLDAGKPVIL